MRFSDSTHFVIPKPIIYPNSDSSLFSSDELLFDQNSSQIDPTSSQLSKPLIPPITSSTNLFSKNSFPTITNDNVSFKQLIKTHQNELPINKSRHPSLIQYVLPNSSFDRNLVLFHETIILDSSSDTSPSAPSLHSNSESQTTTTNTTTFTHTRNVTPVTPLQCIGKLFCCLSWNPGRENSAACPWNACLWNPGLMT